MIPAIALAFGLSIGSQLPADAQVESALLLQSTQASASVDGDDDAAEVVTSTPEKRVRRKRKPITPMDKEPDYKKEDEQKAQKKAQNKKPAKKKRDAAKTAEARAALKKRFDTDGDGKLSESERQTMRDAMKQRREAAGQKGGQEGGQQERQKGGQQGVQKKGSDKPVPTREVLQKRFDADGDGKLSNAESKALHDAMGERRQQAREQARQRESEQKKGEGPKRREVKRKKPAKDKEVAEKKDGV